MYIHKGGKVNKGCRFLGVTSIGFFARLPEGPMKAAVLVLHNSLPPLLLSVSFWLCIGRIVCGRCLLQTLVVAAMQLRERGCAGNLDRHCYITIGFAVEPCLTSCPACFCWCTVLVHLHDALADYLGPFKNEKGAVCEHSARIINLTSV